MAATNLMNMTTNIRHFREPLELAPFDVYAVRFVDWQRSDYRDGRPLLLPQAQDGIAYSIRFDKEAVAAAFSWLKVASWADMLFSENPDGDLPSEHTEVIWAGVEDWLRRFGRADRPPGLAGSPVDVTELFTELVNLRAGLSGAEAVARHDIEGLSAALEKLQTLGVLPGVERSFLGRGIMTGDERFKPGVFREWLLLKIQTAGARLAFESDQAYGYPARLVLVPGTAIQLLWMTLGVTAGAFEPQYPVEGLLRCADERCSQFFTGREPKKFCSEACQRRAASRKWMASKRVKDKESTKRQEKEPRE